ncbi:hypothetical protein F4777DRAFT_525395 [Nemania sp. FL0916]|nr:hypothetical protein F4777DRAFT_525395 [Nemania sp. FL0916]
MAQIRSLHQVRWLEPGANRIPRDGRHRKSLRIESLRASSYTRKGNQHSLRTRWGRDERDDGRRLARDRTVTLPGEGGRRTPCLKRQEAFWAPRTWDIADTDVAVDDAALYRMGILYDDDNDNSYVRGSGFSLDAIIHEKPTYSLRSAKRAKKSHGSRLLSNEDDSNFSIKLISPNVEKDADAELDNDHSIKDSHAQPLATIYELDESSKPAPAPTPVSDPLPDCMPDFYVTDSDEEFGYDYDEEDDDESEENLKTEKEEEEEEKKKIDPANDEIDMTVGGSWAWVLDRRGNVGMLNGDAARLINDADAARTTTNDCDEETTTTTDPTVDGAWIVLARDDS